MAKLQGFFDFKVWLGDAAYISMAATGADRVKQLIRLVLSSTAVKQTLQLFLKYFSSGFQLNLDVAGATYAKEAKRRIEAGVSSSWKGVKPASL